MGHDADSSAAAAQQQVVAAVQVIRVLCAPTRYIHATTEVHRVQYTAGTSYEEGAGFDPDDPKMHAALPKVVAMLSIYPLSTHLITSVDEQYLINSRDTFYS